MAATESRSYLILGLAALAAQALLLAIAFPASELLSARPLFHIDSAFHWYQARAAQAFAAEGAVVGYDPWFGAGYLGGVSYNASAKLPALLAVLLGPAFGAELAYKAYSFGSGLVAPAFVAIGAALLRLERTAAAAAATLGLLIWWISALHWYHTAGMVSFVLVSFAALPYAAWALRTACRPFDPYSILGLGATGALGLFLHPLFPLPVIFLFLALAGARWREIRLSGLAPLAVAVPLLAVLPNLVWMLPSLAHPGWADSSLTPYQKEVDIGIAISEFLGRTEGHARGARMNPVLWFAALWGIIWCRDNEQRRLAIAFVCAAIALILYAALGAALPVIATTTPNRMSATAYLLLVVPAGIGVASMFDALRSWMSFRKAGALAAVAVIGISAAFFSLELRQEISQTPGGRYGNIPPEVKGVGPDSAWILQALQRQTDSGARVLFETSRGRIHDGAHMAGYLALNAGREFIGGPYVYMHHAGFWDGWLFGRSIDAFSESELEERFRLYNIGWAVVHSPQAKARLEGQPGVRLLEENGVFRVYAIRGPRSYVVEGAGRVAGRRFNEIALEGLQGPAATLRYHYVPGIYTVPATRIEAVHLLDDPQPFIRILNPPPMLSLRWR